MDPIERERLSRQRDDVYRNINDDQWHTLSGISEATGHPEASISARLRDIRKYGHTITKRRKALLNGELGHQYEYRLGLILGEGCT